ncbi:hypothetical protein M427DRAFT_30929 [Gonapodya prolifera JEL478]|uniref:Uncharacterized protein n=1 Tax=Gonapodya prolifera (strain JEL478) TaxID=1344416 RepID=A0A139AJ50_GONPJ|nr:hypothetical protein M427DRAFT_30929 [Gonapodya prolifera JEL478]|eukprot:KXS16816.1 hypothetical protein M427DRAFT_30929 [Gonapodya prolifera JEL478]
MCMPKRDGESASADAVARAEVVHGPFPNSGVDDVRGSRRRTSFGLQTDTNVTATFADGTQATGDFLVAADGINFKIRTMLFPSAKPVQRFGVGFVGLYDMGITPSVVNVIRYSKRITPIYISHVPVMDTLHKGRVIFIGDSGHGIPPSQGQGLSQTIEDCAHSARTPPARARHGRPIPHGHGRHAVLVEVHNVDREGLSQDPVCGAEFFFGMGDKVFADRETITM